MTLKKLLLLCTCLLLPFTIGCSNSKIVDAYAENEGRNFNYLCGIDQFGRAFEPVTGMKEDKDVGMFYFLWHGESGVTTFNNTQLLKENPDALFDVKGSHISPINAFHYWDEPIYGYYRSDDKWVIAKHCELMSQAGIDFIVFDTTNGFVYEKSYTALLEVFSEYQERGWNVPKVAFYTNSMSIRTMNTLYDNLYKKGLYKDLWYCPDGERPLIIGALNKEQDIKIYNNPNYNPPELTEEFLNFFDLRSTQWPFDPIIPDGFPWMEWIYPQPNHNGVMNVSLAQHPQLPFSGSYFNRNLNMGRGYNFDTKENIESESPKGLNAQFQWDTVHKNADDIHTVFVTGWNEWIAQKLNLGGGNVGFVDCFNEEFSRDIEPAKNGTYQDAFIIQLIENVRKFKGINNKFKAPDKATIDINGEVSQWDSIRNAYLNISETEIDRNSTSVDNKIKYVQEKPRNIIQEVKITHDKNNVYFMIRCEEDITSPSGENWMNVLIGTGDVKLQGWETYNFCIGREVNGDLIAVNTLDKDGNATKVADGKFTLKGNVMQIEVKLSDLNLKGKDKGFYFKVADDVNEYKNIMDYYVTGESFPMGRLSYYYYFN